MNAAGARTNYLGVRRRRAARFLCSALALVFVTRFLPPSVVAAQLDSKQSGQFDPDCAHRLDISVVVRGQYTARSRRAKVLHEAHPHRTACSHVNRNEWLIE
jgi:hypothetical protein